MKPAFLNSSTLPTEISDEGERRLANAVILQAWTDFAHKEKINPERKRQIETARAFFLSPGNSDWGASRRIWCDMAGLSESALVRVAHGKAAMFQAIQDKQWADYVKAEEEKKMLKRQKKREAKAA